MKNLLKDKENKILFSIIAVTLVIASLPLFSKYCILGHDSEYHLLRIEALKEGILEGLPFLKVNVLFFGGAGYASSMFYPDFLLYIPALLRVAGVSINASWHIFIFICIALCFLSAYFCTFFMTKNKYAALISGILFTLCSYHIDDIYVRAAVGEYTAFIFMPVFLYGLYNVCFENMDKPQLLAVSLAGILLCHTLSFLLCIIITVVILIINYKAFLNDKKLILRLVVTGLVTVALTGYYLFPMLEQLMTDEFYISKPWIEPSQEAMQAANVFGLLFPTVGVGLLLFILPRIIIKRNDKDNLLKFADECIVTGMIPLFVSIEIFPWNRIGKFISVIQFPWRLFQVSSALLAFAGAIVVFKLGCHLSNTFCKNGVDEGSRLRRDGETEPDGIKIEWLLVLTVLVVMVFTCFYSFTKQNRTYYDYSNDYYDYKPFTANVIAGEWLPARVNETEKLIEQSEHVYDADGNEIEFTRAKNKIVFESAGSEFYDVPFIYYNGYGAKTLSGAKLNVDGGGINGMTRVYTSGINDYITVSYKGTAVQHISLIISVLTLTGLIGFAFIKKKKKG